MPLDLQYDLVNYTPADSVPVEANFNRLQQYINTELINRSGTVAMIAQLQLVGDPVNALDAAPKQYVDTFIPIGAVLMFAGAASPPGGKWALCNGAELEQAAYPDLFTAIGQAYGGTSGHFNLPNLVGRFPIGVGTDTIGSSGGSRDASVVAHTHDTTHTHPLGTTGNDNQHHTHAVPNHLHYLANEGLATQGAGNRHNHNVAIGTVIRHNPFAPIGFLGGGVPNNGVPFDLLTTDTVTTGVDNQDHGHYLSANTGNMAGAQNTGGVNNNHNHSMPVPAFIGSSGAATGAVAGTNANMPPYLTINFIIRIS